MSILTVIYALLFYIATAVLVLGVAGKIRSYAKTPAPLKIPTTPAPTTAAGVRWRMTREVVLFESLFKSSKWTWIFGWLFHVTLLLVTLRHLRYFQDPVWLPVVLVQPFGTYAGFVMVLALGGLWARRWLVDRVRYISTPVRSPDAGAAAGHWPERPGHAFCRAHRHRRAQGLCAGPDAF